jgi:hypothetical protein
VKFENTKDICIEAFRKKNNGIKRNKKQKQNGISQQ